jgi:pilus assembly protein CpaB
MNMRKLMLMMGALIFAAVCAISARSIMSGGDAAPQALAAPTPEPSGPEVLVATRTLPVGTIVGPDAFRYQPWPKDLIGQAYYLRGEGNVAALNGTVVRYTIPAGQPITQGAIIKPGDRGFLAAALGPGMRAVTIAVSAQSGVAGFVFPGDRVDLLLTQSVAGEGEPLKASETIVRNLRVLATDQRTDKNVDSSGKTEVQGFSNVTVEVTPKLSEKIAVAQTMGTLSLSLRSIADDTRELDRAIAAGEVDAPGDAKAARQLAFEIATQPNDRDTTATTGSEVSRFQRAGFARRAAAPAPAPVMAAAPAPSGAPTGAVIKVMRAGDVALVPVAAK